MAIFSLKKLILLLFLGVLSVLPFSVSVRAMESQQYQLEPEEITNESVNTVEPTSSPVVLSPDQLQELDQKGFIVQPDLSAPFSFSTEKTDLSLGTLSPNTEANGSNNLKIISENGYQIMISAIRPLSSLSGSVLQNTTCDKGCTYLHAVSWLNDNQYGLGYTLVGESKAEDFIDTTYYRSLPDLSKKQSPTVISKAASTMPGNNLEIRFKLIPSKKDTESYSTIINLDALPTF